MRREAAVLAALSLLLVGCAQALPVENVGAFPTDPRAVVVSPKTGDTVKGPDVKVQLSTQGTVKIVNPVGAADPHKYGEAHFDLFLDGAPAPAGVSVPSAPGVTHTLGPNVTLKGVASGTHTLYAELAFSDHTTYSNSLDTVTFCVDRCSVAVKLPTPSAAPSSAPPSGAPSAAPSGPAGPVALKIQVATGDPSIGGQYKPNSATVKVGSAVEWDWTDPNNPHSVTSDSGDPASFDSTVQSQGATFVFTFSKPGTYKYTCSVHPDMHGTITVQ